MKQLLFVFFLIAVVSGSITDKLSTLFSTLIDDYEHGSHLHFDIEKFLAGVNKGLNVASNQDVAKCLVTLIPTVKFLGTEIVDILDLHWDHAFDLLTNLGAYSQLFQTNCQATYDAYLEHFAGAIETFKQDREEFFDQVVANLKQDEVGSISSAIEVVTFLLQNQDSKAGEALGDLINIALSSFILTNQRGIGLYEYF